MPTCFPKALVGIVIPLLSLLLAGRGVWIIVKGGTWGLGTRGKILEPLERTPFDVLTGGLLVVGWGSLVASRLAYVFGNPGGAAPELALMVVSAIMAAVLVVLMLPFFTGKTYTLRMTWYTLGGLAAFLFFFTFAKTPCGPVASALVYYGIAAAFTGTVLRLWRTLGRVEIPAASADKAEDEGKR